MLSREQVRGFYDRLGAKQDSLGFYEATAIKDLITHAELEQAEVVFEFGCGTGRFAQSILEHSLSEQAVYYGIDLSTTMIQLSDKRLAAFGDRVQLKHTDGSANVDLASSSIDKFISNYVVDLLPPEEISQIIAEAHRVLTPGGYLCLVSLTHGRTRVSQLISWAWAQIHTLRPILVGGCRPIELLNYLNQEDWQVIYNNVVVTFGVPSEVVIACPRTSCPA